MNGMLGSAADFTIGLRQSVNYGEMLMKKIKWAIFRRVMINPLTAVLYWVLCYHLYSLCQFGRKQKNLPILAACLLLFAAVFFAAVFRASKAEREPQAEDGAIENRKPFGKKLMWISFMGFAVLTLYYGPLIYRSAQAYEGRLSWYIDEAKHKRSVELVHDNIYSDGIQGLFDDLGEKLELPEELYLSSGFNLHFGEDGTIYTIDTFLYGWDEYGNKESYLISYDREKSENEITVYLDNEVSGARDEDKLLKPMITILSHVPIRETVSIWTEKEYGILYYGMRKWGDNSEGIIFMDDQGGTRAADRSQADIRGYTVSLFVPGKEDEITPVRYLQVDNLESPDFGVAEEKDSASQAHSSAEEFCLDQKECFRLNPVDAALGKRYYSLEGSKDNGKTWEVINEDPFLGQGGGAAGITFINSNLGFMALSHNGGDEAELYRTEDGGRTTTRVELPYSVMEEKPNPDEPFDFPSMPYEEDGTLKMLIGQGADGDYHGGSKGLYQSTDQGKTWEFVEEIVD